jgi:tetratricopeptide (TPR) repeat protein
MIAMDKCAIFLSACLAAFLLAMTADAATIKLANGRVLAGEVLDYNEAGVRFRRWDNSGVIDIRWNQMLPDHAKRLMVELEMTGSETDFVEGMSIYLENGQVLEGVVLEQDAQKVQLKTYGGIRTIVKGSVLKMEPLKLDAAKVYAPAELYSRKAAATDMATAQGNFDLACYCLKIGQLDMAKQHFQKALDIAPAFADRVQPKMEECAVLEAESGASAMLAEIEKMLGSRDFEKARELLAKLAGSYPASKAAKGAEQLAQRISSEEQAYKADRLKYLESKVSSEWFSLTNQLLSKAAAKGKMAFTDARSYVEKTLTGEIEKKLAETLKMPVEDVSAAWKNRKATDKRTASYGDGTFIVVQSQRRAPAPWRGPRGTQTQPPTVGGPRQRIGSA